MEPQATCWRWRPAGSRSASGRFALTRRGTRHGSVERLATPPAAPEDIAGRFARGEPILLRGWVAVGGKRDASRIESTRRWFEALRRGEPFEPGLRARLERSGAKAHWRIAGVSEDVADPCEIEKVHVTAAGGGRKSAQLYAKLSWIVDDDGDESLRLRFSHGLERSADWRRDLRSARAADRLAEAVFPECRLLADHRALFALLERLCGRAVRLSERIVYNNAPGGGASFHHDAEPGQLGVVYGQLCGATGWLALPREELAEAIAAVQGWKTKTRARAWLAAPERPTVDRLLNRDSRLTRELVARGAFYRLSAGDVLILPSPSPERCAWHSVFALGSRASIAHSYGLFAERS